MARNYLEDGRGRHTMHCHELYEALGLDPRRHLPDEGVPPTDVNGVTVYVLAKGQPSPSRRQKGRIVGEKTMTNWRGTFRAPMMKRTFAICPECGKHVEAGHLFQHARTH